MNKALHALLVAGVATVIACGSDEAGEVEPTFASIQSNIFDISCTTSSCHGDNQSGDLDLRSGAAYDQLVGVDAVHNGAAGLKRVQPGDPDKSFLVIKLEGPAGDQGDQMPRSGSKLSPEKIDAVRTWIADGAKK